VNSYLKIVNRNKRKWLVRLSQNGNVRRDSLCLCESEASNLTGRERAPNPLSITLEERGKPILLLSLLIGQPTVRKAYGSVGKGDRKKRMPDRNRQDMGLNVTQHESGPTSDWSHIARKSEEPFE